MAFAQENIAPVSEDLRKEDLKFDIFKGLEQLKYLDGKLATGLNVEEGDWLVRTTAGFGLPTTTSKLAYPVIIGNNRYDAVATGNITTVIGGGFVVRTIKFVPGTYTLGQALTVKDLGAGERVPSAAGTNDVVIGRVHGYDAAKGIMEIIVTNC